MKIRPPWYESVGLIPWMILIFIILVFIWAVKDGYFPDLDFTAQKDRIDGISKIVGMAILVLGGVLSYFRFFKGRTLQEKININPTVGVISLGDENLHWIDVQIENKGSVSIWNYTVTIYATVHGDNPYSIELSDYMPDVVKKESNECLVDVGETASEHAFLKIPPSFKAVTFQIIVRDNKGTIWDRCITGSNDP